MSGTAKAHAKIKTGFCHFCTAFQTGTHLSSFWQRENIRSQRTMHKLFEDERSYVVGDPELDLIGSRELLAQWRYRGCGPAYHKQGRKIVYLGYDLNSWLRAQRVEPQSERTPMAERPHSFRKG